MNEKRVKRSVNTKSKSKSRTVKKEVNRKIKIGKKKNIKLITIVDYTFLASLVLTVVFGMQTNTVFLWPFTIMLVITIVCMCIILINAIYSKIKKKFRKEEN